MEQKTAKRVSALLKLLEKCRFDAFLSITNSSKRMKRDNYNVIVR